MKSSFWAVWILLACVSAQLCGTTPAASAQTIAQSDYEAVLIPIHMSIGVAGAYGSRWQTEEWIRNTGTTAVTFFLGNDCHAIAADPCFGPVPQIPPSTTVALYKTNAFLPPNPGTLVYVEKARMSDVAISLRVADVSRRDLAVGTQLPVARERDFRAQHVEITAAGLAEGWRGLLRIYSLDANNGDIATVRVYDVETDRLTWSASALFLRQLPPHEFNIEAAYAQLPMERADGLPSRMRIEILSGSARVWALFSAASNATSDVTLATSSNLAP